MGEHFYEIIQNVNGGRSCVSSTFEKRVADKAGVADMYNIWAGEGNGIYSTA